MSHTGESADDPLIEVSDLYDAFHEMANLVLRNFELDGFDEEDTGFEPGFDVLIDQIELDLFLPACARRVWRLRGLRVEPDDVPRMVRLFDTEEEPLHGAAGQYHSHAFVQYSPDDDEVPNEVLSGDLLPRSRGDVRLFIDTRHINRPRASRPALRLLRVVDPSDHAE
jgi:hypothetical protein